MYGFTGRCVPLCAVNRASIPPRGGGGATPAKQRRSNPQTTAANRANSREFFRWRKLNTQEGQKFAQILTDANQKRYVRRKLFMDIRAVMR